MRPCSKLPTANTARACWPQPPAQTIWSWCRGIAAGRRWTVGRSCARPPCCWRQRCAPLMPWQSHRPTPDGMNWSFPSMSTTAELPPPEIRSGWTSPAVFPHTAGSHPRRWWRAPLHQDLVALRGHRRCGLVRDEDRRRRRCRVQSCVGCCRCQLLRFDWFRWSNPSQTILMFFNCGLHGVLRWRRPKPLVRCGAVWPNGLAGFTPNYAQIYITSSPILAEEGNVGIDFG
jgi:hypothetical protein